MQSNVVVQGGIYAARAQAVGDSPQTEHPELAGDRETEQRRSGHAHTEGGHLARAQRPGEPVAVQAGNDGAQRDDHGQDARIGKGDAQLGVHGGPCRPQQGIWQAKADKGQVNDRQQKLCHRKSSSTEVQLFFSRYTVVEGKAKSTPFFCITSIRSRYKSFCICKKRVMSAVRR